MKVKVMQNYKKINQHTYSQFFSIMAIIIEKERLRMYKKRHSSPYLYIGISSSLIILRLTGMPVNFFLFFILTYKCVYYEKCKNRRFFVKNNSFLKKTI